MTNLTVIYRSHKSLLSLPELIYGKLHTSSEKRHGHHEGPDGYKFICSDSRLVPHYIDKDQQYVEACIVLEQVLQYFKDTEKVQGPLNVCIISSTRKQVF